MSDWGQERNRKKDQQHDNAVVKLLKAEKRIAELETALIQSEQDWEQERRNFRELEATIKRVTTTCTTQAHEFHERSYPYSSLGIWVRVEDIMQALQENQHE